MSAPEAAATEPAEPTLGDFVKQLIAALSGYDKVIIPFENAEPWHMLFYNLKKDPNFKENRPKFFESLIFDWDGPYPKSKQLEDFLHSLHWNAGVSARNPGYKSIEVPGALGQLWQSQTKGSPVGYQQFFDRARSAALASFQSGR